MSLLTKQVVMNILMISFMLKKIYAQKAHHDTYSHRRSALCNKPSDYPAQLFRY